VARYPLRNRSNLGLANRWRDAQLRADFPHTDEVVAVTRGYGNASKPGDFLDSFTAYDVHLQRPGSRLKLVILRGNSGSYVRAIGRELQRLFGRDYKKLGKKAHYADCRYWVEFALPRRYADMARDNPWNRISFEALRIGFVLEERRQVDFSGGSNEIK
jgi:hypothetical protein